MTILVGNGFHLTTALGAAGTAAEGTVLSASDLGQIVNIQTDGSLEGGDTVMHAGDSIVVDTDDDGDFSDEAATLQVSNDRFSRSTITYTDGSTSRVTLEVVTLSDGTQTILVNDAGAGNINASADQIESITLGTLNTNFVNRYNQGNYSNTITNSVVCFSAETLIQTPNGEQKIVSLDVGDDVMTAENGVQKIAWIGKRTLSSAQLVATPHLKPVRIRAGALGAGLPRIDLLVSPQHRILIVSKIAKRMFGQKEVLVPAIKLIEADGIEQVTSVAPVTYIHMLFAKHQIVFANGTPAESLYTGPLALQALSDKARNEIYEIFPELKSEGKAVRLACPAIEKQARVSKLLARHEKNRKPLVLLDADGPA
ncbi:MAG: Hint domain-containing protein [Tateyamaria sp.]|uniref:Hint domain-containing protein n=1 Tax=Tateyamaria sp. TaxID=1929288 RepID=UPI00329BEA0C